ncbi:hypothetical protein Hdeb2414_s0003g00088031 [Helianthus debilis subsp. tardiflorus]
MAESSNPHTVEGENPDPSSPAAAEEEGGAPGGGLPVLKWMKASFDHLMTEVQISQEYGAVYPQEGDTGADAPTGYVTMWADFFNDCNLRLPLTVFVADVLEWQGRLCGRRVVDSALWRIFDPDFKGKVEVLACADGEEGFNFIIRDNFRLPEREAMEA